MTPLERRVLVRAAESPGLELRQVAHDREEREALVRLVRAALVRITSGSPARVAGVNLSLLGWAGPTEGPTWTPPPDPREERIKARLLSFFQANPGATRTAAKQSVPSTERGDVSGLIDELVNAGRLVEREEPQEHYVAFTFWPKEARSRDHA